MASLISAGTERSIVEFAEKNLLQKTLARPDLAKQVVQRARREGWINALQAARDRLDSELVLGYSNAGVVIDVGEGVTEFKIGDRVACAGGGFATHSEVVRIPRNLAALIPIAPGLREVSFEEAAFATVGAIALQGIRLAELQLGESVAVIGLGLIGQIAVQLARASGCTVIGMDLNKERCQLATSLGCAATAQNADELRAAALCNSGGRGVDAVLVAAATESSDPVALAAEIARDRGRVVVVGVVGMSLPRAPYYSKELLFRVSRSSGPGRYDPEYEEKGNDYPLGYVRWTEGRNVEAIIQLLSTGHLDFNRLVTHRFPIDEAVRGYDLISGRIEEPFLGIVITYPSQASLARRIPFASDQTLDSGNSNSVCVGVIGAGKFATSTLLPAMRSADGIRMVGICAAGGSSARSAGARFGFRFCASDEAELLQDPDINTIVICTRHSTHAKFAADALKAGKHVFCEKPLALDEEQLASVFEAHDSQLPKRLLTVGYNRRYAPLAVKLKGFLSNITEPVVMHYRVNAGFIPKDHWIQDPLTGGGRILGEVCHFVDFLIFLCGQPVISVCTSTIPNLGRYSGDNLAAILSFADGSLGTIVYVANGDKSFSKERVEVFAQGSVATLDDFRELHTIRAGVHRAVKSRFRVDKGHREEWRQFSAAVRNGVNHSIPLSDLLNGSLTTLAIARAAQTGSKIAVDSDEFIARVRGARLAAGIERGI
jgi:predicted dehydrogenase